jgi:hypothetical protein
MHGEFLRLLFLQAHPETEAHFTAAGMPSQRNQSESFRLKRAAFYQGLKRKVGLAAAKAAALRIPKWGPQRETRQTVREGLNDVWVGGR